MSVFCVEAGANSRTREAKCFSKRLRPRSAVVFFLKLE